MDFLTTISGTTGSLFLTLISFLVVLTVVVFVHEFGHFWVGRLCGVGVTTFSIGFGRELLGWTDKKGTRWRLAAIPLGGYVKFVGDLNAASVPNHDDLNRMPAAERAISFPHQNVAKRAAIVAAAGFGKTTLLAQAVQENALSPLGEDRWLTCQRDDSALSFLASGAFAALGVTVPIPDDPRKAAVATAEAMWSAAPRHVALILDDVHLVDPTSPGGCFLRDLVEELPRNGHLVIASRPPLPLPTARLLANGDATVVGEGDMPFRDDEVAAFATSRSVPRDLLSAVGGWPALAELTATAGPGAVTGYVWEELLSRLSAERRHALAVLVAVGGADDEIAAALLGHDVHMEDLLDGLPLVVRDGSGWWSLHGLWSAILSSSLVSSLTSSASYSSTRSLSSSKCSSSSIL